eukprot:TRINITY_DN13334_c0_g1_i1.p1 TRINITY_DN13334_c0_g1~~TRINITY_DN13334_c0_g1_i1.p1  ORF type:complete len:211 (-),score=22.60 TRINITY_DN13334_c0_g1_i1:33-635(-)
MELFWFRAFHFFSLFILNSWILIELILQQRKAPYWFGPILRDVRGDGMAAVFWFFYISKLLQFADTIIMLLRHSFHQIYFGHYYHHASMFLIWWFNTLYYPGGEAWPSVWVNCLVHVLGYSSRFMHAFGVQLPWKLYLNHIDLVELAFFISLGTYILFTGDSEFKFIALINGFYAFTVLLLVLHNLLSKRSRTKISNKTE